MNKPICCNKPCQPVKKEYGKYGYRFQSSDGLWWDAGSVILYFRCRVCGLLGVPFTQDFDSSYMESLEAVRLAGIEFDNALAV